MKKFLFTLVFLAGCSSEPPVLVNYHMVLIRPDGVIHKEWDAECETHPYITACEGQAFLWYGWTRLHIPNGWIVEVKKKAEKE